MKKLLFIFLMFIYFNQASGQDYVVLKNGLFFNCKIKTITKTDILFSDSIPNDTTTRFLKKSMVLFIRYETGIKEIFNTDFANNTDPEKTTVSKTYPHDFPIEYGIEGFYINNKKYNFGQIKLILLDLGDPGIDSLLFQAHRIKAARTAMAFANIPFGIFSLGLCISAYGYYDYLNYVPLEHPGHLIATGIMGAVGIANIGKIIQLGIKKRRDINMAIDIYNNKIKIE
jgi:hypothetical protein